MQSEKYEIDDGENEIESNDTSFGRGAWVCGGETWQARARVSTSEVVGRLTLVLRFAPMCGAWRSTEARLRVGEALAPSVVKQVFSNIRPGGGNRPG